MSRKGYPKARTGCITCKKRKIKCDETHPYCKRCTTTGRKCDGYAPLSHSYKYSWEQLLAPRMPLRIRNPDASSAYPDGRAMAYFHAKVAEAIFRPLGGDNWAHRLSRMAQSDPAVQHAALAIAALYEQRYEKPLETVQRPCENKLAIQHYNAAIRVLLALPQPYPLDNLLLVCALFVCIELLRDDPSTAINHIRYGTLILDSQPVDSELAPLFYHWNALPYVYGIGSTSFPLLQDPGYLIDASFKDLVQAQMIIDRLAVRILRLGSRVHHYRLSAAPDARVCTVLSSEQYQLQVALHVWLLSFLHFQQNSTISNEIKSRMLILEMQWLVWKIYTSSCLDLHETVYDLYMEYFQRIMQNATALAPGGVPVQSALDLGMGYFTSIFYVVVSCRHLKLRLTALRMLELSSQTKEQIWGVPIFQAIGKHLIEIEHCITLTKRAMEPLYWNNESLNFPVDTRRIRGYIVEPGDRQDSNGKHPDDKRQAPKYNVRFILRDVDNGITSEYTYQISVDRAC